MADDIYNGIILRKKYLCFELDFAENINSFCSFVHKWALTLKHRETHGCVVSTVATDALVLKHQAISILSTD